MFKRPDIGQTDTTSWVHSRANKKERKKQQRTKTEHRKSPSGSQNNCWTANNSTAANWIRGVFNITQRHWPAPPPPHLSLERGRGSGFTARQARVASPVSRTTCDRRTQPGAARVLPRKIHKAPTARDGGVKMARGRKSGGGRFSESPSST